MLRQQLNDTLIETYINHANQQQIECKFPINVVFQGNESKWEDTAETKYINFLPRSCLDLF